MMDAKKAAEMEQQIALASEVLPQIWGSLYRGLIKQNFEHTTAVSILQTYIIAAHSDKIFAITPDGLTEKPKE